jgi:hypothetical protein
MWQGLRCAAEAITERVKNWVGGAAESAYPEALSPVRRTPARKRAQLTEKTPRSTDREDAPLN